MADFSQGFDPGISLQVGGTAPAAAPPSAIDTINAAVNIRNASNQNTLFQQQQSARYNFGRLLATAPDRETALAEAAKDPSIAPYISDILVNAEGAAATSLGRQQTTQSMAIQGTEFTQQMLEAGIAHPSLIPGIESATSGLLGPAVQAKVTQGTRMLDNAVNSGTPAENAQNRAAVSAATNSNPDVIRSILNEPAPSVSAQPVGPGGATQMVQTGSTLGGASTATVMGQGTGAAAEPGATAPPAPLAPLTGQTPLQLAVQTSEGQEAGDTEKDMIDAAQSLPNAFKRLDTTYNTLSGFLSGGGRDTMANLAKGLQAVRDNVPGMDALIPAATVDKIAGGNLGDVQLFKETIIPTMAAVLRASSTKQTANEINSYIGSIAEDADPRAILGALGQMRFALQNQSQQLKAYNEFKSKINSNDPSVAGQTMDNFLPWYYTTKFDTRTGAPLDQSAFPGYSPAPVLGVGASGEPAGTGVNPPAAGTTGSRKSLKAIFGG